MDLEEVVKKDYVENDSTLCFKTTPIWKVVILGLLFSSYYYIFLLFGYWRILQLHFGHDINPYIRTFFTPITTPRLFAIVDKYLSSYYKKYETNFEGLAWVWIILSLALLIFERYVKFRRLESLGMSSFVLGLTIVVDIIILLIVVSLQSHINDINKKYYPEAPKNGWTVANILWVVLGVLYYIALLVLLVFGAA
ncbi:hypothetical protein J6A64_07760 [bacterium]|nr:hypothetical protein [bacterium]